ncbi:MAG: hypothetical protein AAF560_31805 [Acidobacteriota bacterium]
MRAALALTVALLATGCASRGPVSLPPQQQPPPCALCQEAPDSPRIAAAYRAALDAASRPEANDIAHDLTPILPETPGLVWNDDGKVLMSTWTQARYYEAPEGTDSTAPFALAVDVWLTPAPAVRTTCQKWGLSGSDLVMRLEQRIGLPPANGKDAFVELWIDPEDLFRPCLDQEITDTACEIEVPIDQRAHDAPPWNCDTADSDTADSGDATPDSRVNPNHRRWLCENWAGSFGNPELFDNYPWTALGFTYDWGDPQSSRGFSEFVAAVGTEAVLHDIIPTAEYCLP